MGRGSVFIGDPRRARGRAQADRGPREPGPRGDGRPRQGREAGPDRGRPRRVPAVRPREGQRSSGCARRARCSSRRAPLIEHIPRNADVQAADFDGDGDLDLVVASYGFRKVGGTLLLRERDDRLERRRSSSSTRSTRGRAPIHVPVADLNGDGRPDFVALVAQQYEHVVAFLNRGPGRGFRQETIFRAITPVWGSSGIQLVDLDKDGDLDVLMTNGDTLDDFTIRPVPRRAAGSRTAASTRSSSTTSWRCPASTARRRRTSTATATSTSSPARSCRAARTRSSRTSSGRATSPTSRASAGSSRRAPGSSARTRSRRASHPRHPGPRRLRRRRRPRPPRRQLRRLHVRRRRTPATRPTSWVELWENQAKNPAAGR